MAMNAMLSTTNLASHSLRVCLLSRFNHVRLFATLWTVALLSMGFSRQEYWSGLPCPPPGDLPDPGIELTSPVSPALAGQFFTTVPPGKLVVMYNCDVIVSTGAVYTVGQLDTTQSSPLWRAGLRVKALLSLPN